jgi:hypothetical protein
MPCLSGALFGTGPPLEQLCILWHQLSALQQRCCLQETAAAYEARRRQMHSSWFESVYMQNMAYLLPACLYTVCPS